MPRPLSAFRFVLRPPPTSTTSSTSTGRFARCSSLVGPSSPSSFSVLRSSFSTFFSVRPSFLFRQSTRGQRSETKEKREPEPGRRAATKRRVRKGAGRLRDREHRHTQHKEPTINHCNPLKKKTMPEKTQKKKIIIEEPKEQERGCRWRVRPQTRRRGRGRGRGRGHSCSFAVPVAPKSRKKRHQQQQQQQQSLVAPSSFSSEHSRAPVPVVGLFFFLLFACFVFQCRARRVLRPFASSQRKTHQ